MFKRTRSTKDFAEEIEAHLELEADELMRAGISEAEAHRLAHLKFGSVRGAQERFYLRSRREWLDNTVWDMRFAIRQLAKNPGFAATVIIVLALGMGAGLSLFTIVDAALLQPLPYPDPQKLMSVNESSVESPRWPLSYPDYLDWQRLNTSFSSLDIYSGSGFLLHSSSGTEPVQAERVSGSFFETLGVRPLLGRGFRAGEDRLGGPDVALLSYGAWLHRLGARRDVVGQTINLDGRPFTIIGVLPRGFSFAPAGNAEFWVPLNSLSTHERSRTFYNVWGIGRLRPGVTMQAAQAQMSVLAERLQRQYGIAGRNQGASVVALSEVIVGEVRPVLLTLLSGAGLLLLIACVNVASLILVRSESRRREIAVRRALGATPMRLLGQFVTEGVLLAALGSLAGGAVAYVLTNLIVRLVPKEMTTNLPFLGELGLNGHTAAFGLLLALLIAGMIAITPLLRLSSQPVRDDLAEGSRGAAGSLWRRFGANLVVVELAVAVVLLAGAGLLGQSLYRLLHVPLGFDATHLATAAVTAPSTVYTDDQQMAGLYREIVRRVSSLPGAQSVGMTSLLPVQCDCAIDRIRFPESPSLGDQNDVDERHVSPDYLSALEAGLVRGRFFTEQDDASSPGVAVVNLALARKYFPDGNPVGKRIADDEAGHPAVWEIVGVVRDVHEGALDVPDAPAEYFPIAQTGDNSFSIVLRTRQDAETVLPDLVETLHQIDSKLGVSDEETMAQKIEDTQAALLHRLSAWLVGGFAVMALLLGVIGLYAVIAYSVSQRKREIGVRMALGAQRRSVYSLVMRQAGWLTAMGLAIGLACSIATSLSIRGLLFHVQPWDAKTLAGVTLLLGLASIVASFLPAHRAASVNPVEALRAE